MLASVVEIEKVGRVIAQYLCVLLRLQNIYCCNQDNLSSMNTLWKCLFSSAADDSLVLAQRSRASTNTGRLQYKSGKHRKIS